MTFGVLDSAIYRTSIACALAATIYVQLPVISAVLCLTSLVWVVVSRVCNVPILRLNPGLPSKHNFLARMTFVTLDDPDQQCGICMDNYDRPVQLPCRHMYCCACISFWLQAEGQHNTCPECGERLFNAASLLNTIEIKNSLCVRAISVIVDGALLSRKAMIRDYIEIWTEAWPPGAGWGLKIYEDPTAWELDLSWKNLVAAVSTLNEALLLWKEFQSIKTESPKLLWRTSKSKYLAIGDVLCLTVSVAFYTWELQHDYGARPQTPENRIWYIRSPYEVVGTMLLPGISVVRLLVTDRYNRWSMSYRVAR